MFFAGGVRAALSHPCSEAQVQLPAPPRLQVKCREV